MFLDRILYPVTALGPGNRIGIWTVGCSRKCFGCANPELWIRHPEQKIEPTRVAYYINAMTEKEIDGITITGGEPFEQASEIIDLIDALNFENEILVFSGYQLEELRQDKEKARLLSRIDVLIDGSYIQEMNDGMSALRGSTNQMIHFLNESVIDRYEQYIKEGRQIQNFMYDYKIISVGIHNP